MFLQQLKMKTLTLVFFFCVCILKQNIISFTWIIVSFKNLFKASYENKQTVTHFLQNVPGGGKSVKNSPNADFSQAIGEVSYSCIYPTSAEKLRKLLPEL